jgi:repressor LexA
MSVNFFGNKVIVAVCPAHLSHTKEKIMNLSDRQKNILQFIAEFVEENSFPPTIREIGQAVGISSTSVVKYNLSKLEKEELILRQKEVSRGLSLNRAKLAELGLVDLEGADSYVENGNGHRDSIFASLRVPVLGPIAAGHPIEVEPQQWENADEWVELNSSLFRKPTELYALRVQGDSMVDASVLDGDIVILRHQNKAENGEMVAAWIDGENETTLKRFYLKGDKVQLQPCNPSYPVMEYPANKVRVQGKVVSVIRTLE